MTVLVPFAALLLSVLWITETFAEPTLATVDGRFLRLITDLPQTPEIEAYVQAFDQVVPQWLSYWNRSPQAVDDWRMVGYLMTDKQVFRDLHLIPSSLPDFANGYNSDRQLWVVDQPSSYYTLHLLLHEGAHGIAQHLFGGAGAPWYMEGTAEWLATHERDADTICIGVIPRSREASPHWGRMKLIADRRAEGKMPSWDTVLQYGDTAHREVEPYAWSWVAVTLMEMYPEYRAEFRAAAANGHDSSPRFTALLTEKLAAQQPQIVARWKLLCHDLDYGFDRERNRVDLSRNDRISSQPQSITIAADRGWQAAPFQIKAGQSITIRAAGEYALRADARWTATASGVTYTYYRGRPLGRLIACIVDSEPSQTPYLERLEVIDVGTSTTFIAPQSGYLLLKVNDSPAELRDNQGALQVELRS